MLKRLIEKQIEHHFNNSLSPRPREMPLLGGCSTSPRGVCSVSLLLFRTDAAGCLFILMQVMRRGSVVLSNRWRFRCRGLQLWRENVGAVAHAECAALQTLDFGRLSNLRSLVAIQLPAIAVADLLKAVAKISIVVGNSRFLLLPCVEPRPIALARCFEAGRQVVDVFGIFD